MFALLAIVVSTSHIEDEFDDGPAESKQRSKSGTKKTSTFNTTKQGILGEGM